jgi:CheY-like chemotaxis protein
MNAGRAHILYIDDEEALVVLATRMLKRLGYRVTAHTSAARALDDFVERPSEFDAMISDLSMPGMSGIELARCVRGIRPDLRVLLTSGCVLAQDIAQAAGLGVPPPTTKPDSVEGFARMLNELLSPAPA